MILKHTYFTIIIYIYGSMPFTLFGFGGFLAMNNLDLNLIDANYLHQSSEKVIFKNNHELLL